MTYDVLRGDLRALEEKGRLRVLRGRAGVDFTSNDYLGLAESDELRLAAAEAIRSRRSGRLRWLAFVAWKSFGARGA